MTCIWRHIHSKNIFVFQEQTRGCIFLFIGDDPSFQLMTTAFIVDDIRLTLHPSARIRYV
jgi:hypothetical protein